MRKAFNLMMAIMIIIILSTVAVLTLKYASISAKHYADSYIKEQAELFMQSIVEATILEIEGYDKEVNSDCLREINFISPDQKFTGYVKIEKYFVKEGDMPSSCDDIVRKVKILNEHPRMVLLKIVVESSSENNKTKSSKVRLARRSLQIL